MKERPILFSTPMVQAILNGTKTQERRVIKPQPTLCERTGFNWKGWMYGKGFSNYETHRNFSIKCPYGQIGDRLWVRETLECANNEAVGYPADGTWLPNTEWMWKRKTLPSIFMPRWASRITLEITNIRVERLNDISEEDAEKEGIAQNINGFYKHYLLDDFLIGIKNIPNPAKHSFTTLWESINGAGSWEANPLVWVIEFKKVN